jgi:hypothetical protein
MADKKLRIPRKLKTETVKQLKIRTDMNSDGPYECSSNFTNTTSRAKELGKAPGSSWILGFLRLKSIIIVLYLNFKFI